MIKKFIANRYKSYTPDGKFWLTVGFVALVVDMAIGYNAGSAQATIWHGIGGAGLALGFAFLPDAVYEEMEHKRYAAAIAIGLICIPVGIKAYEQQLTYTAGMRHGEMTGVRQVNARKASSQHTVTDNEALLGVLNKQLADLTSQNSWATSVKAEALREQVANADAYIKMEGERGGCKTKCETRMRDRDALITKIGVTEQATELNKRIEATKRALETARSTDDGRETKTSLNLSVAETTAAMFNIAWGQAPEAALQTSEASLRYATIGSAGLGALALLLLAPVGFFLAGRRRIIAAIASAPVEATKAFASAFAPNGNGSSISIGPGPARVILTSRAMTQ